MGLQFRKRTKGKNSWINVSHSKKNGLSASLSVKLDKNLTLNFGGKGNRRATINFGNGVRYVKYRSPKVKETSSSTASNRRNSSSTYIPIPPRNEFLTTQQRRLVQLTSNTFFEDPANLQVLVDFHNAIEMFKEDETSQDIIDLITVTANSVDEMAKLSDDNHVRWNLNSIAALVRQYLPEKVKTKAFGDEDVFNAKFVWGVVIFICLLITMCSA